MLFFSAARPCRLRAVLDLGCLQPELHRLAAGGVIFPKMVVALWAYFRFSSVRSSTM